MPDDIRTNWKENTRNILSRVATGSQHLFQHMCNIVHEAVYSLPNSIRRIKELRREEQERNKEIRQHGLELIDQFKESGHNSASYTVQLKSGKPVDIMIIQGPSISQ